MTLNKRSKYTAYYSICITYHLHIIYRLRNRRYTRAFNVTLKNIFRNKLGFNAGFNDETARAII